MKPDKTIFVDGIERKIHIGNCGYERFKFKNKPILVHRYIWEQLNGKIPDGYHIHHKDENKLNNSIDNLECISASEHAKLHHTGNKYNCGKKNSYKGGSVTWHIRKNKWQAIINRKHLGRFHTKLEAYQALFNHDTIYWTTEKQEQKLQELTK